MNPSAEQIAVLASLHDAARARRDAHRDALHRAAIARRRKAKRGGRR